MKQKTEWISLSVLILCLLLTLIIYSYTGDVIIALLFAPPIIHWILKKREEDQS